MLIIIALVLILGICFLIENKKVNHKIKTFEDEIYKNKSDKKEQTENPE